MATNSGAQNITAVATTGTAVAALLLALRSRTSLPGEFLAHLDEETLILLASQAQTVSEILDAVKKLTIGEGGDIHLQGYPLNTRSFVTGQVNCAVANTAYQLPDFPVPDGYELLLKAHPNNAGIVSVSKSGPEAATLSQAWPMLASEMLGLGVSNAKAVWVAANLVNQVLCYTVEQR